ncbi:MAG TPA: hypothetical protein VJU16_06405 [Planctomycetota bacterium]|nr:hypothetical protein [Planctomycetota bacterium]
MKIVLSLAAGGLLLASCSTPNSGNQGPQEFIEVRTRADLDNFSGKDVAVEGTFGHVAAQHGTVTLASGLVIYVPHFDKFKQGDAWLRYVGRPVRVEGQLHTETTGIPGIAGPLINIRRFESLDFTE